jgi:hypothetical protein
MYVINKTDGNIAATVNDGVIDTSQTDITLVGKNYLAYGEVINENFVKMLENFANTTPPTRPLTGELWYDTAKKKLFVYNDLDGLYKTLNVVTVQGSAPSTNITGDLWYDSVNAQLKFWNGAAWQVITPIYTSSQGISGPVVETITSNVSTSHVVTKLYNGGSIVAVLAEESFTPSSPIPNFGLSLSEGLNLSNTAIVNGTVTNSQRLANLLPASFMRTDQNTSTTGTITVTNNGGLILGAIADLDIKIDGNGTVIASKVNGNDINFYVRNNVGSNINALNIASDGNVTFIRDVFANNFIASQDVNVSGNIDVTLDANIGGTVTAGIALAAPDLIVTNINTSNLIAASVDSTTANITNLNSNLVCINTVDTTAAVNIAGSIQLEGQDYVAFVDGSGNEGFIQGNNGELLIGTQNLDAIVVFSDQTVDFIEGYYSPNAEVDNFLSGNITISGNVITTTSINGDVNIYGDGTGAVLTGNLISSSVVESPIVLVTATNQATGLGTGALRVNGGVSINRSVYVGENLTVSNNIVCTNDLTVTGLINGQLAAGVQTGITAVGTLTGLTVNGAIFATGDITAFFSSDARFKDNVQNIPDALSKIKAINGVTYDWNDLAKEYLPHANDDRQIGVIAQEIQAAQPELVKTRESGYLAVDYEKLTAVLIEAVKELSAKVETLEAKLDSLQS